MHLPVNSIMIKVLISCVPTPLCVFVCVYVWFVRQMVMVCMTTIPFSYAKWHKPVTWFHFSEASKIVKHRNEEQNGDGQHPEKETSENCCSKGIKFLQMNRDIISFFILGLWDCFPLQWSLWLFPSLIFWGYPTVLCRWPLSVFYTEEYEQWIVEIAAVKPRSEFNPGPTW